jgi:hypothetical protein
LRLDLKWEEIAELDPAYLENYSPEINNLVDKVKEIVRPKIADRCDKMRFLERAEPINLTELYSFV